MRVDIERLADPIRALSWRQGSNLPKPRAFDGGFTVSGVMSLIVRSAEDFALGAARARLSHGAQAESGRGRHLRATETVVP